jgi:hypothetical protein
MKKPAALTKAARLAEVAKKTGGLFVFATRDANLLAAENTSAEIAKSVFKKHTCRSCSTEFAALSIPGLHNHCMSCGSDSVVVSPEVAKVSIPPDAELSYLTCSTCGTHQAMHDTVGKEVAHNHLSCTTCGSQLQVTASDDTGLGDDTLSLDDMELLDIDGGDALVDEAPEVVAENDDADFPTNNPPVETSDDAGGEAMDPADTNLDLGTNVDDMPSEEDLVEMEVLETVDDSGEDLQFAYFGPRVAVLSNTTVVATLGAEEAGSRADMLHTENFRLAFVHEVRQNGLKKALASFNFKPSTIKVPVKAMVERGVEAALKAQKAQVTAALDGVNEQFQHAVDIAAAGFAANFWRDKQDPVKRALVAELSAAGVKHPEKLVDRVMATHGVAQLRGVLELARTLANKPVDALNSLSDAIELAKYVPFKEKASEDSAEDDDVEAGEYGEDEEDAADDCEDDTQVATVARAVELSSPKAKSSSIYRTPELSSILGDRPLFLN